jgi:hypothetical protein
MRPTWQLMVTTVTRPSTMFTLWRHLASLVLLLLSETGHTAAAYCEVSLGWVDH